MEVLQVVGCGVGKKTVDTTISWKGKNIGGGRTHVGSAPTRIPILRDRMLIITQWPAPSTGKRNGSKRFIVVKYDLARGIQYNTKSLVSYVTITKVHHDEKERASNKQHLRKNLVEKK